MTKITRPYPLAERSAWDDFWKSFIFGAIPDIIYDYLISSQLNSLTLRRITVLINQILKNENCQSIKIGKTGDAEIRADQKDYRTNYHTMYLIYRSKNKNVISKLESDYIKKYKKQAPDKIDNIIDYQAGNMYSYDGYYYLYVVVR